MPTVRQLLDEKGDKVFSVPPTDTVYDALRKMEEKDVGSLIVIDGEKVVGIITERDYARKVILKGRASPTTRVQDIMETKVLYAQPDQAVEECMAIMTDKRVRHLPVLYMGSAPEAAQVRAFDPDGKPIANTWQGIFPVLNTKDDGYDGTAPVRLLSAQRLRPLRHDRQCLGVDDRLVFA